MAILPELLLEHGICARHYRDGGQKLICPRCSRDRKKPGDPCLSLTIAGEKAVWNCHHCGWSGSVSERETNRLRRPLVRPPSKPTTAPADPSPAVLRWLADRGISEATARRNRIGAACHYIPALRREVACIAFPYFRDGELINIKFRALREKVFTQVKGAEAIAYGIDDIAEAKTVIIVEGECDKLALEEAGCRNGISVPNGAQSSAGAEDNAAAFAWLAGCAEYLDRAERIILAVDADERGQALEAELARRLGKERCWRIRWPDSGDVPCKDANETLQRHGADTLRECVGLAEPYPIAGLHGSVDFEHDVLSLYREGRQRGLSTGWPALDEYLRIRAGELTIVTGIPGDGKSEFIDALAINLAERYGWRFALCSFENPPEEHIAKLAEKFCGLPFWDGPTRRMTEAELRNALAWISEHFHFIRFDDDAPTVDAILAVARASVVRYGVRGLVIDPYNEIEHRRPAAMTETEYVSQLLGGVKRFAANHGVHVWIVAHPAKLHRVNDKPPVASMLDISGSANWANKADIGLVVHRPEQQNDPTRADIYIRKVRFKSVGKRGVVSLRWDRATGRYTEIVSTPYSAAKAYRDD